MQLPTLTDNPHPAIAAGRDEDVRQALRLTYLTLGWMSIEGLSSVILGWLSSSLLLTAFGIDSGIELLSAGVLLWRLKVEATGRAEPARIEAAERRAARLAGYALLALSAYVVGDSAFGLLTHHMTDTRKSVWGIIIGVIAAVSMPLLAKAKLKVAAPGRLNSKALRADAMEAFTCGYLSWVMIAGLICTRLFGWWWLDCVAALALVPFLLKEAREAIRGECACCH